MLVNPGFPSDTAEAYRLLDAYRETHTERAKTPRPPFDTSSWPFSNDFLPVLTDSDKGVVYQRMIEELRELGAEFAGLSGSGSICFGVFSEQDSAESARNALSKHWPFVIFTFLLVR